MLRALRAGASGFLLKDAPPAEITEAILRPTSEHHRQSTTTTAPTNCCTATAATPTNRPDAECSFVLVAARQRGLRTREYLCPVPTKQRSRGMLIARAAVVSIVTVVLSLLLLGGTAAAVTVEPQSSIATLTAAAPAAAIAGAPAARAETVASAAVTPAAATSLSPLEQLWQYLLALFQQFLARFFPPPTLPLPYSGPADQVVTVVAPSPGAATATVTACSRSASGWTAVIGPVQANIGPDGVGPASEATSVTPAGVHPLTQAFGRQVNPGTRLPYFQTDRLDWWRPRTARSRVQRASGACVRAAALVPMRAAADLLACCGTPRRPAACPARSRGRPHRRRVQWTATRGGRRAPPRRA